MQRDRYDKEDIELALRVLREGGIIVYPTDTVWGIGCDATNESAVSKIYALKHREDNKSMLVLLDSPAKLDYYVSVPNTAELLLEMQNSKPLTIIYPKARNMARNLIADDGSIGIRITEEPFSKELCARFKSPIVSTSANISGHPTAHFFQQIEQEILEGSDYVCRYRRDDMTSHESSSVIKVNIDNTFEIIRN